MSTPLEAISARLTKMGDEGGVKYAHGCTVIGDGAWEFNDALAAAEASDTTIMFLGGSAKGATDGTVHLDTTEKEGLDRTTLSLPGLQEDLLRAIAARTNTTIILVVVAGGPIALDWAAASPRVSAILHAWYPGQRGGAAIADVLFGLHSPAGRLPVTIYHANYTRAIKMTDMRMRAWPGRTHRFLKVPAVFPFGYGMSYTSFTQHRIKVAATEDDADSSGIAARVVISFVNSGRAVSDHVLLLFASFDRATQLKRSGGSKAKHGLPRVPVELGVVANQELVGFQRLRAVVPGGKGEAAFELPVSAFTVKSVDGADVVPFGKWQLHTGNMGGAGGLDDDAVDAADPVTVWTLPPLPSSARSFRIGIGES